LGNNKHILKQICPLGFFCSESGRAKPCGAINLFCPPGASKPKKVSKGYYTVGNSDDVRLRIKEVICERGHFW